MSLKINIPTKEFRAFTRKYPNAIAQIVVNFSRENWRKQGYYIENTSNFKKWPKRKRETRFSEGKAVLVSSGNLRASVKKISATPKQIIVGSTLPYSDKHNEGRDGMPKRQFINDNLKLGKELEKSVTLLMKKVGL